MLTRRRVLAGISMTGLLAATPELSAQESVKELNFDIQFPPLEALNSPTNFGYTAPTKAQKERVAGIINDTPHGPTPLDIARSFVLRFSQSDPDAISQWPKQDAWNPLIVEFFKATSLPANNDMINWCAAFTNWCIARNGKFGTRSASSQSFLAENARRYFPRTNDPEVGDLVVWTCYDPNGKSLGLGHVAFVSGAIASNSVLTLNGNVSSDGRKSIIAEKPMPTGDKAITRNVDGQRVSCTMRLSAFLKIA